MALKIPIINSQFVCIVDYQQIELAAVISSYLSKTDTYLPIFSFPFVHAKFHESTDDIADEGTLSSERARTFATLVNNVLARMKKCENIILAGLSVEQNSYLNFLGFTNVIEVSDISQAAFLLSAFQGEKPIQLCRSDEILLGLHVALQNNLILKVDNNADHIYIENNCTGGVVVLESEPYVASVIAINYAHSIDAEIVIAEPLENDERYYIQEAIQDWQNGDVKYYDEIKSLIEKRINVDEFIKFEFATFFTTGLPYSLVLNNCIPCSYVHIYQTPDLFIIIIYFFKKIDSVVLLCFLQNFLKTRKIEQ